MKFLEVVCVERYIAINDIARNRKSKSFHQKGIVSLPVDVYKLETKRKGVTRQCNIQSELTTAPKISGFKAIDFIVCFSNGMQR